VNRSLVRACPAAHVLRTACGCVILAVLVCGCGSGTPPTPKTSVNSAKDRCTYVLENVPSGADIRVICTKLCVGERPNLECAEFRQVGSTFPIVLSDKTGVVINPSVSSGATCRSCGFNNLAEITAIGVARLPNWEFPRLP
jgi:hypothetical protein